VVTVRLTTSGFYSHGIEFRSSGRTDHEVLEP
jgi:hypothetical protein